MLRERVRDAFGHGLPSSGHFAKSNLNAPWFGGSRYIPKADTCDGNKWRALIIYGLNQAAVGQYWVRGPARTQIQAMTRAWGKSCGSHRPLHRYRRLFAPREG